MSGHNKWSSIKHKKGANDAKRGKLFTKLGKVIAVAVKQGGIDVDTNPALANAIAKARTNNMPSDNINRIIKKSSGDTDGANYEDITYEGYGSGGSAVIVECLTDNKNRTAGDIRHLFDKFGGSLGTPNSVSFMFNRKGILNIAKKEGLTEDQLFEWILEAEAEDMVTSEEGFEVITAPNDFIKVKNYLEAKGIEFASAEIDYIPGSNVVLPENKLASFNKMIDQMEDNDDVQNVYHNVENL
jgi:YebC/PmpR family DNA-binding regulatory protein